MFLWQDIAFFTPAILAFMFYTPPTHTQFFFNTGPISIDNLFQSIKGATHFKGHTSDFSDPSLPDPNFIDTVVVDDKAIVKFH